jgi:hypothetical protein
MPPETYSVKAVDVPEMVTKFMESHDDTEMLRTMRSLRGFLWERELCAVTDETSVVIIR